jgi:hypothetical protein
MYIAKPRPFASYSQVSKRHGLCLHAFGSFFVLDLVPILFVIVVEYGVSLDVSLIASGIRSTKPSSCTWDEVLCTPDLPFSSTVSVVLGFAAGGRA